MLESHFNKVARLQAYNFIKLSIQYRSSNINEVIKTVLSQCIFFTKRYCTHKNSHMQKLTNKKKKLTLDNKGNNFSRVQTSKKMKVAYFALVYSLHFG